MLENLEPPKKKTNCKVKQILDSLSDSDREILLKALADRATWSDMNLSIVLKERGLDISHASIQRHRLHKCTHG